MFIRVRKRSDVQPSEITPDSVYLRRREFMAGAMTVLAGAVLAPGKVFSRTLDDIQELRPLDDVQPSRWSTDEEPNSFSDITSYNNFYEFGPYKRILNAWHQGCSGWSHGAWRSAENAIARAPWHLRIC